MVFEFENGGMWESSGFKIETDYECSEKGGDVCDHSRLIDDNSKVVKWVCPRVVIAYNEGGYSSTGVCLDCILEAVKVI